MNPRPHASLTHNENGPTVPQSIRDAVGKDGGYTFLGQDGSETKYSFTQISKRIDERAVQLVQAGFVKGDRVGFVIPDPYEFLITFIGAMQVGVIPVPMYPPMSFGKLDTYTATAARILRAADATALITTKQVQTVLWSLLDRVPKLERLGVVENFEPVPDLDPVDLTHIQPDDVAFLQFTSGSTSTPKGVTVTHSSLLANLHVIMKFGLEISEQDVAITWLPMYHDMGLIGFMLAPMWYAVPTVFIPTLTFVKHPTKWMEAVSKYRGSITFAPNFAFALAVRRTSAAKIDKLDLSSLKALGCGAEPNHPGTLRRFLDHFAPAGLKPEALLPCYGMAEATLAMTFCGPHLGMRTDRILSEPYHDDGRAVPVNGAGTPRASGQWGVHEFVSCGRALPGHEAVILDDHGSRMPDRVVGEVVFRGPSITAGYFREEEATAATFRDDGLHTGDLGYLVDGELFVTGRKKDIIILNGRNYDPQTIEWEVAEVAGVRKGNVVAFSVPSAATEELVIVAETKTDAPDDLKETILRRVRENLSLNAHDVVVLKVGQLPKTSSGKLQRRRTRGEYLDGVLGREVRTMGSRAQSLTLAKHLSLSMVARVRHSVRTRTQKVTKNLRLGRRRAQLS